MNVPEDPRNTGLPHTSDGRAGHSPVNKNVNGFKKSQSPVDQWFMTFGTLVEFFGFFLPANDTMSVRCHMLFLVGVLLPILGPQRLAKRKEWESVSTAGRSGRGQQGGREELSLRE